LGFGSPNKPDILVDQHVVIKRAEDRHETRRLQRPILLSVSLYLTAITHIVFENVSARLRQVEGLQTAGCELKSLLISDLSMLINNEESRVTRDDEVVLSGVAI
jgi:hypothetical protein